MLGSTLRQALGRPWHQNIIPELHHSPLDQPLVLIPGGPNCTTNHGPLFGTNLAPDPGPDLCPDLELTLVLVLTATNLETSAQRLT